MFDSRYSGQELPVVQRFLAVAVGFSLALALPFAPGCQECGELEPEPEYNVRQAPEMWAPPDWVPGTVVLHVMPTRFLISYETMDGSQWEVEYTRTEPAY